VNAVGTVRAAARPGTYTGENRISASLLLFLVLVGISVARNGGKLPDQRHAIALLVAVIFIAAAAAIAPRIVFYLLLAAVLVIAFQNSSLVANYIDAGTSKVRAALAGA
jgi:hypothetical protein